MPILWIIEPPSSNPSLVQSVQGLYPTRVFASISSLFKLSRIAANPPPDGCVFIVDAEFKETHEVEGRLKKTFPKIICLFFSRTPSDASIELLPTEPIKQIEIIESHLFPKINSKTPNHIMYKGLQFNTHRGTIVGEDHQEITLTKKESTILQIMMMRPEKCITREELKRTIWGNLSVSPRTIDVHISRLRKHLGSTGIQIENIYGGGYVLR